MSSSKDIRSAFFEKYKDFLATMSTVRAGDDYGGMIPPWTLVPATSALSESTATRRSPGGGTLKNIKVRGGGFRTWVQPGFELFFSFIRVQTWVQLGFNFWKSSSCSRVQRTQY